MNVISVVRGLVASALVCFSASASADVCEKGCLLDITEAFLEAKASGDISDLEIATSVVSTENGTPVPLGEGATWQDDITIVNRHTFVDPHTQTAIFFGTVAGAAGPDRGWWHYNLRLTLDDDGAIAEVEQISDGTGFKRANALQSPFRETAIFDLVLPEDERSTSAQLIDIANRYWDALEDGDASDVPYAPDCQRTNVGTFSTNLPFTRDRDGDPDFRPQERIGSSCRSFHDRPPFRYDTTNRRFYVVDEARGITIGLAHFKQTGGPATVTFTLMEAFKIANGRIEWMWGPALAWGTPDSGWADWDRPQE
ncbi:MAG: hypothetical protein AAF801_14230 [Pseudomonadota bacterium]